MTGCNAERHGDNNAYINAGCRCPEAREAQRIARARSKAGLSRMVDATGTGRRLRALSTQGWDLESLGNYTGIHPTYLGVLRTPREGARVTRRIATVVDRTYRDLAHRRGPSRHGALLAETFAVDPPEAWTDDTIDDPDAKPWQFDLLAGQSTAAFLPRRVVIADYDVGMGHTRSEERIAAVLRLTDEGLSAAEIARMSGVSSRTVQRLRSSSAVAS